jgi:cation diffusion facilitator family transporter
VPDRPAVSTTTLAIVSIGVGLVVLALKLVAWRLTGSVALYSDALESIVNVATAIAALAAVWYSARPADPSHPYGHEKAEYLSVVLEGVLIVVAAVSIFREAWLAILAPAPLDSPFEGIAVNVVAGLINGAWCIVLIRVGRRRRSPALEADGVHLLTDVLTSLGVVVGLLLALLTGWLILDPILAALVALNILWQGWKLIRSSVGGLMDAAAPAEMVESIRQVISSTADGAIEAHDVKTRRAGRRTFIEFHLVVPGAMSVEGAHNICDRVEAAIGAEIEGAQVVIHVEPEYKAKYKGAIEV